MRTISLWALQCLEIKERKNENQIVSTKQSIKNWEVQEKSERVIRAILLNTNELQELKLIFLWIFCQGWLSILLSKTILIIGRLDTLCNIKSANSDKTSIMIVSKLDCDVNFSQRCKNFPIFFLILG